MKRLLSIVVIMLLMVFMSFLGACEENNNTNKDDELMGISLISFGKTEYYVGDDFDPSGFVLELAYVTPTTKDVTIDMCDVKTFDKAGNITITISYESFSTTVTIKVTEEPVLVDEAKKIEIKNEGLKVYSSETPLDLSGYLFIVTYSSGKTLEVKGDDAKISADITSFSEKEASYEQEVLITYDNKVSLKITVSVLDEWDYEDYLEELEYIELIKKLDNDLEKVMPEVAFSDIPLPSTSDYDYRLKLSWDTSNEKVISVTGKVSPREEDVEVTLSLDAYPVGSSKLLKHYEFKILVEGLGPIDFEDLSNKKIVMAYFYEGTYREMPKADGRKIDIMCYCFGRVDNGKLSIGGLGKINTVMKWRRDYQMRILLSIGGGASGGFSGAVKDAASRKKFVDSIMDVVKEYDFDGIDLDWEYPGWSGLADSTAYDVENFSYLLRDLRAALDEYKEGLLLTAAVISSSADKFYQPKELNKYLDYVNIMTYDGNNTGLATHHTKPYGSGYSAVNAINLWINAGVDPKKIVVGAAFYGKISELSTPVTNPEDSLGKATLSTSTLTYTTIVNKYLNDPTFRECYDPTSKATYLSDGRYFITYDNFDSIIAKAGLVKDYNLAGMMFWDYGSDSTGQLLSAVYSGINALNK